MRATLWFVAAMLCFIAIVPGLSLLCSTWDSFFQPVAWIAGCAGLAVMFTREAEASL